MEATERVMEGGLECLVAGGLCECLMGEGGASEGERSVSM